MACYLASDVHLRPDRPARARRFARWVRQIEDGARLLVAGDLCDFWMVTRQQETDWMRSDGLAALHEFTQRGGTLSIMPGNHDLWVCPFYERALGAAILQEPHETKIEGLRLHIVHGHLLGARRPWKAWMESREFWLTFQRVPAPFAGLLDGMLERKNRADLAADEGRHLQVFRDYASLQRGRADLVVLGHVHRAVDEAASNPRMIVLGGWQERSSYLKIDATGASFHVVADEPEENAPAAVVPREAAPAAPSLPTT